MQKGAAILPGPRGGSSQTAVSAGVYDSQAGWGEAQAPSLYSLDWYHNALVQQITYSDQEVSYHPFWRRVYSGSGHVSVKREMTEGSFDQPDVLGGLVHGLIFYGFTCKLGLKFYTPSS